MSLPFSLQQSFELLTCGQCGVLFYVPDSFYLERKERGTTWYCPNGHPRVFTERESDKLRRELEATKKRLEVATADARRETQLRQQEVKKRQKLEKRIRSGVCPQCHRSFVNVKRHMETKHPTEETK